MASTDTSDDSDTSMNYHHRDAWERTRDIVGDVADNVAYPDFKRQFEAATVNNPEWKNRSRMTDSERANTWYYLSLTRQQYMDEYHRLPDQASKKATSYAYNKAVNLFHIAGTTLMRNTETLSSKSMRPLPVADRRVIHADGVYDCIKEIHERLLHAGRDKTWDEVQQTYYGINREEVNWFVNHCKRCVQRNSKATKDVLHPIKTDEIGKRVQMDLIDMRTEPSGIYKWILHTQDHVSKFMTLWSLTDKSAPVVADALQHFFNAGHQMEICQNDRGSEFKGATLLLMQRVGIKVINSRARHPQSQGLVEQGNGPVKQRVRAWKEATGLPNWDIGLAEIARVHNHSRQSAIGMKPFELHFNAKSSFHKQFVKPSDRAYLLLEDEADNNPDTPDSIARQGVAEARQQGQRFDPLRVAARPENAHRSIAPIELTLRRRPTPPPQTPTPAGRGGLRASSEPPHQLPPPPPPPPPPRPRPVTPPQQTGGEEPPTPDRPLDRPAVIYGQSRNRESSRQMTTRYNRGKTVRVFQIGDVVTVKIPAADNPGKGAPPRLFALINDKRRSKYEVQTKSGIIDTLLPAGELGSVDQALKGVYASEIVAANNTKKVTLRHAARGGVAGPEYIFCGCKKMPCGSNCRCKKNNVKCTTYCHGRNADADCSNNATGVAFNQKALINAGGDEGAEGGE